MVKRSESASDAQVEHSEGVALAWAGELTCTVGTTRWPSSAV
ncbi:hypothetical protein [Streptomyces sp. NPDC002845]